MHSQQNITTQLFIFTILASKLKNIIEYFSKTREIDPQNLAVQTRKNRMSISGSNEYYEVNSATFSKEDFQFVAQYTGYNSGRYSHTEQLRSHCDAFSNALMYCYQCNFLNGIPLSWHDTVAISHRFQPSELNVCRRICVLQLRALLPEPNYHITY